MLGGQGGRLTGVLERPHSEAHVPVMGPSNRVQTSGSLHAPAELIKTRGRLTTRLGVSSKKQGQLAEQVLQVHELGLE